MATNSTKNFSSIGALDAPALRYPNVSGISAPSNQFPDAADSGLVVPMRLTTYSGLSSKPQVSPIGIMPVTNPRTGFSFGGNTLGYSSSELPKIQLEGYIDTPCNTSVVNGEKLYIPAVTFNSMSVTFADIIAAHTEGRTSLQNTNVGGTMINSMWSRVDPTWFRDPFGRVYNNPKVINFTAGYVEGVPRRTTFTMTLQVPIYDS